MARKIKGRYDWENVNKQPTSPAHEKIAKKSIKLAGIWFFHGLFGNLSSRSHAGDETRQEAVKNKRLV